MVHGDAQRVRDGNVNQREQERASRVHEDDGRPRPRIHPEAILEANDDRDQEKDDQEAAVVSNEWMPEFEMRTVDLSLQHIVDRHIGAEEEADNDVQAPHPAQPTDIVRR